MRQSRPIHEVRNTANRETAILKLCICVRGGRAKVDYKISVDAGLGGRVEKMGP